ncbi:MAG: membrane protein insertase YidC [Halothiobacillus sp. 20-53-49]|nr:membrane protein insertase YidC [Halothiobacillaceae bacterium]OYV46562.1 MAG: membrane protein insertase YidC [Halothiobacillus sp. 20-53-49]HUM99031.1 membrane protein insertase YidC [Halothiobacillus sp.]
MDNRRLILVVALGFVFILLWQAWTKDQQHAMQAAATQAQSMPTSAIPEQTLNLPNALPNTLPNAATPNTPVAANTAASASQIAVRTDVLSLKINPQGGVIDTADLLSYPQEQDKAEPVNLLSDSNGFVYVAQSGLLGSKGSPAPDHYAEFQSAQTEYQLQPGQNELRIPLTWEKDGIKITKWFIVKRGDYAIKVEYQIDNTSNQPWQASQYRQLTRLGTTPGTQLVHTYTGGVYAGDIPGSKDRLAYEKVTFEDMAKANLNKALSNGWVAIIEHYFMSAWVPANPQQVNNFYTLVSAKNNQTLYTIGMSSPVDTIAAGAKGELSSTLYVGPKIQSNLAPLAQGLNLTIDYGIFTVIADPIFWLLKHFHEWVGNWGWAIVLVTLVIKIFFLWPSAISYRSMAKMRAVTPKMQQLKERFGEDRQKLSQEMMKLYQKEKINPLGGCLPIVIQIPVFISLYWVLAESVELRQAPWIFWIHDLSQKDPYFVLPLLMGISMFIQQKLNPAPVDPMQQKIFAWLPVIFTIFFSFFPAGLVLYWFVNNLLSIAQQYTITRQIEKQMALAKTD